MSARLTLRQQTVPGPVFPGHRIAPGINKGSNAPLAYFCPSASRGCSAGSALRNTAAPPPRTPLHPSPRNNYIHVPRTGTSSKRRCALIQMKAEAPLHQKHTGAPTALQALFV